MTFPKPPRRDRDDLWRELEHVDARRAVQDQVLWSAFGIFGGATNAVLVAALFVNGGAPEPWVGMVIASIATALSVAWHLIQSRVLRYLLRHEERIWELEELLGFVQRQSWADRGPRARNVMLWCSRGAIIGWCAALLAFFILSLSQPPTPHAHRKWLGTQDSVMQVVSSRLDSLDLKVARVMSEFQRLKR